MKEYDLQITVTVDAVDDVAALEKAYAISDTLSKADINWNSITFSRDGDEEDGLIEPQD